MQGRGAGGGLILPPLSPPKVKTMESAGAIPEDFEFKENKTQKNQHLSL